MTTQTDRRFFFHANAVGLAAHIRRPDNSYIDAVASSCLPVTGGRGSAKAPGARYGDLLSHGGASTMVSGDFIDTEAVKAVDFTHGNHAANSLATATQAEATLTDLAITSGGRVLKVGTLEVKMSAYSDRNGATQFRSLATVFDGISVDGVDLTVATHCEIFEQNETMAKLTNEFATNSDFRARYAAYFFNPGVDSYPDNMIPAAEGLIYGTVVNRLEWRGHPPKDAIISGNSVKIVGLGTVYFGEILIEEGFRRLTTLRFQLGSSPGGCGSGPEVQSNGSTWPPQRGD